MKTTAIINFVLLLFINVVMTSCAGNESKHVTNVKSEPQNYCVAIDLSDRILDPTVIAKDSAVIQEVFSVFEERVKKYHYVKNNDKFHVTIIQQASLNGALQLYELLNSFSIDMSKISLKQKKHEFIEFRNSLGTRIHELYALAYKPKKEAYSGCNVWSFFNTQVSQTLKYTENLHLVVLTDTYIEIDDKQEKYAQNGKTNHLSPSIIGPLRKNDKWEQDSCDILLVPQRLASCKLNELNCNIVGFMPRGNYPRELEMMEKIWSAFVSKTGIQNYTFIPYINDIQLIQSSIRGTITKEL